MEVERHMEALQGRTHEAINQGALGENHAHHNYPLLQLPDPQNAEELALAVPDDEKPSEKTKVAYISDTKKRTKRFNDTKRRIVDAFYTLGMKTGCYGVLYLRKCEPFPFMRLQGRGDNDMRTLRAETEKCVYLTTAIHNKPRLQELVSTKIGEIMDYENVLRTAETQRLVLAVNC